MKRVFGEIDGYPEGSLFENRKALHDAGIHKPLQAGISGSEKQGSDSIVLSGGYEDDEDYGDQIIYTGEGGRDENTGKQISDQQLKRGNLALFKSKLDKLPVRIIRGSKYKSSLSPKSGYAYGGLYIVTDSWQEKGKSGFYVWRFRLEKIQDNKYLVSDSSNNSEYILEPTETIRKEIKLLSIVRNIKTSREIKELYNYQCQICGLSLELPSGKYAEGAHIKPLGSPHNGSDSKDNLLCLCPNCHVLFDNGAISIDENFNILGLENKQLIVHKNHFINKNNLTYHMNHYYNLR